MSLNLANKFGYVVNYS